MPRKQKLVCGLEMERVIPINDKLGTCNLRGLISFKQSILQVSTKRVREGSAKGEPLT